MKFFSIEKVLVDHKDVCLKVNIGKVLVDNEDVCLKTNGKHSIKLKNGSFKFNNCSKQLLYHLKFMLILNMF